MRKISMIKNQVIISRCWIICCLLALAGCEKIGSIRNGWMCLGDRVWVQPVHNGWLMKTKGSGYSRNIRVIFIEGPNKQWQIWWDKYSK